jgi:hypothetical protein
MSDFSNFLKVSPAIQPLNQAKSTTCWLASLEMLFKWKSKDKTKICSLIDEKTDYWADDLIMNGLHPSECMQVARALGMQPTGAGNYTREILYDLVWRKGPLWVGGMWLENMSHAVVITGVDPDSDKISIVNPWRNYALEEEERNIFWLNARGNFWKSYEGSVMHWR